MLAWEESTSITWARVMRGMNSMAKALAPFSAIERIASSWP